MGPDGKLIYREALTRVDKEFVGIAGQGRAPEKRFRFAHKCVERGCKQWAEGKCGIIDAVLAHHTRPESKPDQLPQCAIRPACRWFAQRGAAACAICPEIITDAREDVEPEITT